MILAETNAQDLGPGPMAITDGAIGLAAGNGPQRLGLMRTTAACSLFIPHLFRSSSPMMELHRGCIGICTRGEASCVLCLAGLGGWHDALAIPRSLKHGGWKSQTREGRTFDLVLDLYLDLDVTSVLQLTPQQNSHKTPKSPHITRPECCRRPCDPPSLSPCAPAPVASRPSRCPHMAPSSAEAS